MLLLFPQIFPGLGGGVGMVGEAGVGVLDPNHQSPGSSILFPLALWELVAFLTYLTSHLPAIFWVSSHPLLNPDQVLS